VRNLKYDYITSKSYVMARSNKNLFHSGIWIKNWKFKTDAKPFNSKMTPTQVSSTRHKIEKFAEKKLKDRQAWKDIDVPFHRLVVTPTWEVKSKSRPITLLLTVTIVDPQQPPETSVVAPPPPKQPKGGF